MRHLSRSLRPALVAALLLAGGLALPVAHAAADPDRILANADAVPGAKFGALDLDKLAGEDAWRDALPGPKRFAVGHDLAVSPSTHGIWRRLDDGRWQWRYAVRTPDAIHLNFGFGKFALPKGAQLSIASPDSKATLGPWGAEENREHGQFWTPILPGHGAILELVVPADARDAVGLELVRVGHGYRGFGTVSKACKAGSCNTDVACLTAGDPWNAPRRAVGAYTRNGTDTCTGSLVNNTAGDRRMLFATATHCGITTNTAAQSVVVYWNYESPTCRAPGSTASGQVIPRPTDPVNITNGFAFVAATPNPFGGGATGPRSDFALLELDPADPTPQPNLHWAGWDRRLGSTNEPPGSTTATWPCAPGTGPFLTQGLCASIHHPGVDEKRITFVSTPFTIGNISGGVNVHWRANWIETPALPAIPVPPPYPVSVTEPGSSGSPLYNADRRLVGVLSGGPAACGNGSYWDFYGALFHAWNGVDGATATQRMRDHLDPAGTNPLFLDGVDRCTPPAVPANLSAAATAANEITLSFDAVTGAERYRVFRATGSCDGTFDFVGETTTTSFVDTGVSGNTSYAYRVTSFDDGDSCESAQSACTTATATGLCTRAPDFSGLTSASSAGNAVCGITLAWPAATSTCEPAGDVRFNVFASTDPNFTPSESTLIASCVDATSFTDTDFLSATQKHYVVRVEDSGGTGTGLCGGGLTDGNVVRRSAVPTGPISTAFDDPVDDATSPPLWTTAGSSGAGTPWAVIADPLAAANRTWFTPNPPATTDQRLAQTADVAIAGSAELRIVHRYSTEASWDGGVLEYSLDGGTTWTDILAAQGSVPANANRFVDGGYVAAALNAGTSANPLAGRRAWHGTSANFATGYITSRVNLADFAGRNVRFRFRFGADGSVAGTGWWIDRVTIDSAAPCASIPAGNVFRDGFEEFPP